MIAKLHQFKITVTNQTHRTYYENNNNEKCNSVYTISDRNQITGVCLSIADQFSVAPNITVNIDKVIFCHINVYIQSGECRAA